MPRVVLGADDEEDEIAVIATTGLPEQIPLHKLQPNPENPRPLDLEIEEARDDLLSRGQLQNLNVMSRDAFLQRKPYLAEKLDDSPVVVINGCRRLAAAKAAGLPALMCRYRDDWTENDVDEAMITENVHRRELNPLLLGRHLKRMAERYGSKRKLAKAINKDPTWVRQRIDLTELHPDLQDAIADDRILFKVARECGRLHPDLQPALASGELPESVAQAWLTEERIRPEEQLARWKAGLLYGQPGAASEYPVLTDEGNEEASGEAKATQGEDEYPVLTQPDGEPQNKRSPKRQPQLVIHVEEREPKAIASALREHLTQTEVEELIHALAD